MNKMMATGRLTKDPVLRYTQSGTAVVNFRIASPRRAVREGEPDANFFSCVAWGKVAETIAEHYTAGSRIILEGTVENREYTDNNGGKVRYDEIVVGSHEFGDTKAEKEARLSEQKGAGSAQRPAPNARRGGAQKTAQRAAERDADGFVNVPDDIEEMLPF